MSKHLYVPVAGVTVDQLPKNHHGLPRSGGRRHQGIDIHAREGTPVVATKGGTVVKEGNAGLGGLRIWVRDDEGNHHYYAHLSAINVRAGEKVRGGQQIGAVGDSGNAKGTGPHLHYSVNPNSASSEKGSFDAYDYLSGGDTVSPAGQGYQDAAMRQRNADLPGGPGSTEPRAPKLTRIEKQRQGQELLQTAMTSMSKVVQGDPNRHQMFDVKQLLEGPRLGHQVSDPFGSDDNEEN